ncbi:MULTISPECIES: LCP family protein [Clostridium]|uniref:LytR family transcriptional regulator n=1 Tax=Clostridium botulinum TaxID=1491 RepID=A0A6B4PQ18_CLOBO|nr:MULTISPECIES: LCP family protein [Clostridium]KIL08828.1 transcriptional regulator [Clostridium botulinum]MBN1040975.1 LytR family transcriptional regulator [Clostridium botulinum]MBN1047614.1 LytR family transcriptional regulator [Clostridium botulinum]MBN1057451.1 LytR family transcriptional regulator [Clostridium botulinum]MBN1060697.1 LytR family transcriptional regulator [Clostridium botulinum]
MGKRRAKRSNKSKKPIKNVKGQRLLEEGMLLILALLITFTIVVIGSSVLFLGKINKNDMIEPTKVSTNKPVNILLLGTDIGDPSQPNNNAIKRTDTIMVLNYNPKEKKLQVVSIPRDTLIDVNGKNLKINSAYAIGGEKRVKSEVEKLLNISINYIAKIDYNAFREFIDAIGGIKMQIERNMIYDDEGQNLHINFKKGEVVKLDGKKAEEFFRWRKNNDGSGFANGDLDRIENQQKFISKVVDKCTSPMIIFKIPSIIKALGDNIDTNMPPLKVISYGLKFSRINSEKIDMKIAQGTPKDISGESFLVFDKNLNKDIITSLSSTGKGTEDISKSDITIKIFNGTKITGLAATLRDELTKIGYTRVDVGNIQERKDSLILTNNENIASKVESSVGISKIEKKPDKPEYKDYDVVIILGKDFKKFE